MCNMRHRVGCFWKGGVICSLLVSHFPLPSWESSDEKRGTLDQQAGEREWINDHCSSSDKNSNEEKENLRKFCGISGVICIVTWATTRVCACDCARRDVDLGYRAALQLCAAGFSGTQLSECVAHCKWHCEINAHLHSHAARSGVGGGWKHARPRGERHHSGGAPQSYSEGIPCVQWGMAGERGVWSLLPVLKQIHQLRAKSKYR